MIAEREAITSSVREALRATVFSNGKLIAPRRLDAIGREETEAFLGFLETRDEKAVRQRGQQLALKGLGIRSTMAMVEVLRRACRESVNSGEEAVADYASVLLEGYVTGREETLLQEQERTMKAYLRARDLQAGCQE